MNRQGQGHKEIEGRRKGNWNEFVSVLRSVRPGTRAQYYVRLALALVYRTMFGSPWCAFTVLCSVRPGARLLYYVRFALVRVHDPLLGSPWYKFVSVLRSVRPGTRAQYYVRLALSLVHCTLFGSPWCAFTIRCSVRPGVDL